MRTLLVTTLAVGAFLSANAGIALADPGEQLDEDVAAAVAAGTLAGEAGDEIGGATLPDLLLEGGGDIGGVDLPGGQDGRCSVASDYDPGADLDADNCVSTAD